MSERHHPDTQSTPQAPAAVDAADRQLASARRRRFLKVGGAAVPTALTLASRPVMAWDCNTASMWGSVQGISNTHSSYTRSRVTSGASQTYWADETYTRANWVGNTTRSTLPTPWGALGVSSAKAAPWNSFKKLKVSDVITSPIVGVPGTTLIWDYLNNAASDEYGALMVVAWLNYITLVDKTGKTPNLAKCLKPQTTNALDWMGAVGTNTVTGPDGKSWDKARVVQYLKLNYIATP